MFDGVERQCTIYVVQTNTNDQNQHSLRKGSTHPFKYENIVDISSSVWEKTYNHQIRVDEKFVDEYFPLLNRIFENSDSLGQYLYVNVGATVSSEESGEFSKNDVVSKEPTGNAKKFFQGSDLEKWSVNWNNNWLDYKRDEMSGPRVPEIFEAEKLAIRVRTDAGGKLAGAHDREGMYCDHTVLVCCHYEHLENTSASTEFDGFRKREDAKIDLRYALGLINSNLMTWIFKNRFETGGLQGSYSDVWPQSVRSFPIPNESEPTDGIEESGLKSEVDSVIESASLLPIHDAVVDSVAQIEESKTKRNSLNLNFPDYLGNYADGPTLSDLGYQPPAGLSDSLLTKTESDASDYEKLRVTEAYVERDGSDVTVFAVPYVKPVAEEEHETNSRGYATLDPIPAMKFSDLSESQATLIEVFVPYAVDEASGFAGYRDNATATISPLDRLEELTLPVLSDVENGIESYIGERERAEELDDKIERTDDLIDEIVYELYGLTDEEIEIVEEAVGD